jgi:hypothetical protein
MTSILTELTRPQDLIRLALINCGIVSRAQTIYAEDMFTAFDTLNSMISQWNRKRWLIYSLLDVACTSTGAQSYTIGTGQDFNTPRPDRLEAAYVRLLPVESGQTYDTWLEIIDSHEDYATITLKNLETWPTNIFYDSAYPVGNVYPWPVPPSGMYEVHVLVKNSLSQFPDLTTPFIIPPEYTDAMIWNLGVRLRPSYKLPVDPALMGTANQSLQVLRKANMQIESLKMPFGIPRNRARGYGWVLGISGGFN